MCRPSSLALAGSQSRGGAPDQRPQPKSEMQNHLVPKRCITHFISHHHSYRKEFWGNGVRTHVNSKRKMPSTGKNLPRGVSNPRHCIKQDSEPNTLPTSYSDPLISGARLSIELDVLSPRSLIFLFFCVKVTQQDLRGHSVGDIFGLYDRCLSYFGSSYEGSDASWVCI